MATVVVRRLLNLEKSRFSLKFYLMLTSKTCLHWNKSCCFNIVTTSI